MYPNAAEEWAIYHPPKSVSFGHQSRVRDIRRAWAMTSKFLDEFTTPKLEATIDLECTALSPLTSEEIATECVEAARRLFENEQDPSSPMRRWTLTEEQLPPAIQFALDADKWPRQPYGPIRLNFGYSFAWRDLTDRSAPSGLSCHDQDWMESASLLGVIIGQQRFFLQPTFRFPFALKSPKFEDFLARVKESCPFRFRDGYFKRERRGPRNQARGTSSSS